jgi:IclR family acetate operon transcriptional repressor
MAESSRQGTLGTVHNAAVLLDLLSDGPAHQQLSDLAERSQMSLATVHRLLRSLVAAGLAEQEPVSSRYGLGPELLRLAERYVARLPLVKAAAPYLVALRQQTGATVVLATLAGREVLFLDRIDGDDPGGVYRDASRSRPAWQSAAGRLLAAHDTSAWERLAAEHDATDGDRDGWREASHVVLTPAPPLGTLEVAAPLCAPDGTVVAALGVSLPTAADPDEEVARVLPYLRQAASTVSRSLTHV